MIRKLFLANLLCLGFLSIGPMPCFTTANLQAFETKVDAVLSPTHKQFKLFRPKHTSLDVTLQTFCLDSKGNIVAAVSTNGAVVNSETVNGLILFYSPDFELVQELPLDFAPSAVNYDIDGTLYVAGGGKVAKIASDGKVIKMNATPNLLNVDSLRDKAKTKLEQERKSMSASYENQIAMIDKAIAIKNKTTEKPEEPKTEVDSDKPQDENREATESDGEMDVAYIEQLTQISMEELENMRKSYSEYVKQFAVGQPIADEEVDSAIANMGQVRSIAVGDEDVFVTCPANLGYGYDIWRVNKELEEPKIVLKGVSGCCGQMDIQAKGKQLLVAENTKFRVAVYNQKGKLTSKFGNQDRSGKTGFGSCCNPMNIRCCDNGDVLTAESSIGTIKRFDAAGNLIATIGKAKIGMGCKHVALGHDPTLDRYYMMYEDEAAICVLVNQKDFSGETEDEKLAREAAEGLGKKLLGGWELVTVKREKSEVEKQKEADAENGSVDAQNLTMIDIYGFKKITFESENKAQVVSAGEFFVFGDGTEWLPIQQKENQLTLSILSDQIEVLKLSVEFISEDQVKFGLEFGRGTPTQSLGVFKRIKQ